MTRQKRHEDCDTAWGGINNTGSRGTDGVSRSVGGRQLRGLKCSTSECIASGDACSTCRKADNTTTQASDHDVIHALYKQGKTKKTDAAIQATAASNERSDMAMYTKTGGGGQPFSPPAGRPADQPNRQPTSHAGTHPHPWSRTQRSDFTSTLGTPPPCDERPKLARPPPATAPALAAPACAGATVALGFLCSIAAI